MNVEEVLQNARLEALEADPDKTVCLIVTVSKDTELTEDLSNDIYHSVLLGLAETKWADIPIFVVPEGTTIKAVVVPKQAVFEQEI